MKSNLSIFEHIHNLINLHLYPTCELLLGQSERYSFQDADVTLTRTGNVFSAPKGALTYRYTICGQGFRAGLLASWQGQDQATALVEIVSIGPDPKDGMIAMTDWLAAAVGMPMSPFGEIGSMSLPR